MKADIPDSIIISRDDDGVLRHSYWTIDQQLVPFEETEFIRKDALLDYFRQRVEDLNSPLNGVFGSTERDNCNERISELLLLIDKLNEM